MFFVVSRIKMFICGIFESYANNVMTLKFFFKWWQVKFDLPLKLKIPSGVNYIVIRSSMSPRLLTETKRKVLFLETERNRTYAVCRQHPLMDFPVCKIRQLTEGNTSRNIRKNTGKAPRFLATFSKSCLELYSVLSNVDGKKKLARIFFFCGASVQFNSSEII